MWWDWCHVLQYADNNIINLFHCYCVAGEGYLVNKKLPAVDCEGLSFFQLDACNFVKIG